jgi:hypothetical protein
MYYDTKQAKWHASRATLPERRGNTVGLCAAPDALLAELGIIKGVQDAVPTGKIGTGGYIITVADGVAHRTPITVDAAENAQQAAAEFAQMAIAALPLVQKLRDALAIFGLSIPITEAAATEAIAAMELTEDQRHSVGFLGATWQAVQAAGVADYLEAILATEEAAQ